MTHSMVRGVAEMLQRPIRSWAEWRQLTADAGHQIADTGLRIASAADAATAATETQWLVTHIGAVARGLSAPPADECAAIGSELWCLADAAMTAHQHPIFVQRLVQALLGIRGREAILSPEKLTEWPAIRPEPPAPITMQDWPDMIPRDLGYLAAFASRTYEFNMVGKPAPLLSKKMLDAIKMPDPAPAEEWVSAVRGAARYALSLKKSLATDRRDFQRLPVKTQHQLLADGVALKSMIGCTEEEFVAGWRAICARRPPTVDELMTLSSQFFAGLDDQQIASIIDRVAGILMEDAKTLCHLALHPVVMVSICRAGQKALAVAAFCGLPTDGARSILEIEKGLEYHLGSCFRDTLKNYLTPERIDALPPDKLIFLVTHCERFDLYPKAMKLAKMDEERLALTDACIRVP